MNIKLKIQKLDTIDKDMLEKIYVDSEFIDPISEIISRIERKSIESHSQPFVVIEKNEIVSFFTIESSNPNIRTKKDSKGIYWLESFFITKNYLGKGYATEVINLLLQNMKRFYPDSILLNLTVNFKNDLAQYLYKKCGFVDTSEVYAGGPAGPQYIYTKLLEEC